MAIYKKSHVMLRRAFLAGIALCAWCATIAPASGEVVQRVRKSAASVRVVSANIRHIKAEDDKAGNGWEQRKELCRDVLLAQDADIICCQEATEKQLADFIELLPGYGQFGIGNRNPIIRSNAILYSTVRFEKMAGDGFWMSPTPQVKGSKAWGSKAPRFVNWVHLRDRKTGRELIVWNTHFDYLSRPARENGAGVAMVIMGKIPADVPQVFTGDFNSPGDSRAIEIVKERGWIDTYAELHGAEDPGLTAHQFNGARFAATAQGGGRKKIDFVFRKGPLKTLAAEIIRDERAGRYPSDHYFVSAELEFESPPAGALAQAVSVEKRQPARNDAGRHP
ncbi:endonuclease/exonuclease/phosphatase family protein [Termitidicoccus mucosus]